MEEVEAIVLGGSRAGEVYDEKSDYKENKKGYLWAEVCK